MTNLVAEIMSKAKLMAAKELIQERNYSLARAVLKTIGNHPKALEWLAKLDQVAPEDDLGDPFVDKIPPPPPSAYYQMPIEYEYKTVSIEAGLLQNLDAMVDRKIAEMRSLGWHFVDQKEKLNSFSPKGRILQFRRAKK